jgi:uncharacterized repeat protein (TIGR01451 family)
LSAACAACWLSLFVSVGRAQTPSATEIRNQAWGSYELRSGDGDTARSNTTLTTVVTSSETPSLAVQISADRAIAGPGTSVTYTIVVSNGGTAAATGIGLVDTLPVSTSFASATGGGMPAGRVIHWGIASIGVNGRDTLRLVVRIDDDAAVGAIGNQAAVTCAEGCDAISNTATIEIVSFIATRIELTATPRAVIGNGHDSTALGVTIADADGRPVPDGAAVLLSSTNGVFENTHDTVTAYARGGVASAFLRSEIVSADNITAAVHARTLSASGLTLDDSVMVVYYAGAIAGTVVSASDNSPLAGATVVAYDDGQREVGHDSTGADGRYIIPIPRRGLYRLVISHIDRYGEKIERRVAVDVAAQPGGLPATKVSNAIAGSLAEQGTNLRIHSAGVGVAIRSLALGKSGSQAAADTTVVTDRDGHFLFENLAPGRYEISAADSGYRGRVVLVDTMPGAYLVDVYLAIAEIGRIEIAITSTKRVVEIGEIVGYTIVISNRSGGAALAPTWIVDTLPPGFGYVAGKARLNAEAIGDPNRSRIIIWNLSDTLAPGQSATLTCFAIAGAAAIDGDGEHRVQAVALSVGGDTVRSLPAQVGVAVRAGVFTDHAIVLGKVFYDANADGMQDADEDGVAAVELWMEDGTRVVTGDNGAFSLPDVVPGDRVLRINTATLPSGARLLAVGSAFAGDARSRFVHVTAGGVARADFHIQRPAQAALDVVRSAAAIATPGGSARVVYIVRRAEPGTAASIVLRDTLLAGLSYDLSSITVNDSAVVPGSGRSRSIALDIQKYPYSDTIRVGVTVVADTSATTTPIQLRPVLILSYPTGRDAVFTPQSISSLYADPRGSRS